GIEMGKNAYEIRRNTYGGQPDGWLHQCGCEFQSAFIPASTGWITALKKVAGFPRRQIVVREQNPELVDARCCEG
ncbi:MAG TPA: hypothetical protein VMB80_11610, partial [Candidatus Acidoferrum sp.]|nr:hypothetical protein [Candidatus Acidoferrum sp.]